jgi:drug/metabolite transporter (DMT)-like permease
VGSALSFSVMSVLVKVAGARLPTQEIVLGRALVSLALSHVLLSREGLSVWGTDRPLLVARGVVGYLALSCVYYSVTHLPLAEATVIQYLHPGFTALLAALLLGEALGARLVAANLVALAGVVLVARPPVLFSATATAAALDPFTVAVAVAGAFGSAVAYVLVRRLAASEHPLVIVYYFPLVTVPATLPAVARDFVMPQGIEWIVLLGVGVFTQFGQVFLTRGMQLEPAGRATALSYLQVVFAACWGVLVCGDYPDTLTIAGALLVAAGALAVARNR